MTAERVLFVLLGCAVLAAIVQTLRIHLPRALRRARLKAVCAHARTAERQAETLLQRHGFRVLERQAQGHVRLSSNGEPRTFSLRADLLVGRGADRFVAEVKTGSSAPWLENRQTRRQLLEYSVAFPVDGVLLVRTDTDEVDLIRFSATPRPIRPRFFWWTLLILAAAVGGYVVGAGPDRITPSMDRLLCLDLSHD